jgi:uncharacterized membrane protein YeiH
VTPLLAPGVLTIPPPIDLAAVLVGGLSGSLLAARKRFDLVGVATLAIVAGLGGGLIRDVLLGNGPPAALRDSRYLLVALVAALVGFYKSADIARIGRVLTVVDAVNLGIYTVVGALKALYAGLGPVPAAFLGIVTAVGGGVLRDLLAGETPDLFHTGELYALVSALGSALFVALWESQLISGTLAGAAAIAVMFVLRLLAVRYGWTAPRPRGGAAAMALLILWGVPARDLRAQERPVVLFAVERRDAGPDSAHADPFLVIRGNRLYGPRDTLTRTDLLLSAQLATPGVEYTLLAGGAPVGSVALAPPPTGSGGCVSLVREARVQLREGYGMPALGVASTRADWGPPLTRRPIRPGEPEFVSFREIAIGAFHQRGTSDTALTGLAVRNVEAVTIGPDEEALVGVAIQDSARGEASPEVFLLAESRGIHYVLTLAVSRGAGATPGDVQLLDVMDLSGDGVGEVLLRLPKNGAWDYLLFKRLLSTWVKLYEGRGGGC